MVECGSVLIAMVTEGAGSMSKLQQEFLHKWNSIVVT